MQSILIVGYVTVSFSQPQVSDSLLVTKWQAWEPYFGVKDLKGLNKITVVCNG